MSEVVHYKGTLTKIDKFTNESLEEQCKRLLNTHELPDYYDTYREMFEDTFYNQYVICNDEIYSVYRKDVYSDDMFNAKIISNNEIEFEVMYYNGGCGFTEAIEIALKNIQS